MANGLYNVRIDGATGAHGSSINVVYKPTEEMMTYAKLGGSFILEFYAPNNQWQIKLSDYAGKDDSCNAYLAVPSHCHPHQCPARKWQIYDGKNRVSQPAVSISIASKEDVEAYLAEIEEEAARVVKGTCCVRIVGATGESVNVVNGAYEPTEEMCENATVYRKTGDETMWMEYRASSKSWQVKATTNKGSNLCYAYCVVPAKCPPYECPSCLWHVFMESKFIRQPAVSLAVASKEDVNAYLAEVEEEAARVVKGTCCVRIVGATGMFAASVNGIYEPTDEMCGNATVYRKTGDDTMWIEYHASSRSWLVKPTANKGSNLCYARCAVPIKCLPHECPQREWHVALDGNLVSQLDVTISLIEEK